MFAFHVRVFIDDAAINGNGDPISSILIVPPCIQTIYASENSRLDLFVLDSSVMFFAFGSGTLGHSPLDVSLNPVYKEFCANQPISQRFFNSVDGRSVLVLINLVDSANFNAPLFDALLVPERVAPSSNYFLDRLMKVDADLDCAVPLDSINPGVFDSFDPVEQFIKDDYL